MATTTHAPTVRQVTISISGALVRGELIIPESAFGIVILGFPTGNTRSNPKHQRLTSVLVDAGLATLFCDLLTEEESPLADLTGEFRNDVPLLSARLTGLVDWCHAQPELATLPIGVLGVGAASAAAFITAAHRKLSVRALAVRSGRMDLAWSALRRVEAPVLLVCGEKDYAMREAFAMCLPAIKAAEKEVALIPRAGEVFSDPVALDEYAGIVSNWFANHLSRSEPVVGWRSEVC